MLGLGKEETKRRMEVGKEKKIEIILMLQIWQFHTHSTHQLH